MYKPYYATKFVTNDTACPVEYYIYYDSSSTNLGADWGYSADYYLPV